MSTSKDKGAIIMRLWHYKLIPFLPNSQLLAQWRELNSIFKKQDDHILINYVYEYSKDDLFVYSSMVINEMSKRGIAVHTWSHFEKYFVHENDPKNPIAVETPFKRHHNHRYLKQCFYNLQEKYDRGQKDFARERYNALLEFVRGFDLPNDI